MAGILPIRRKTLNNQSIIQFVRLEYYNYDTSLILLTMF